MKVKSLLLTALLMAAVSCPAYAADQPPGGGPIAKKSYIIYLTNGGTIKTDNYVIEGGKVRVNLPAGAIMVDRSMVKSIREASEEGATVQESLKPAPPPERPKEIPGRRREVTPPPPAPPETRVPTDDEGHTEAWWQKRVNEWKKKLADAQVKYQKASSAWNQYNGVLQSLSPSASEFEVLKYQDMRGSARMEMDKAQADMDEATRMLEEGLPEEARKAGAPPGWVR